MERRPIKHRMRTANECVSVFVPSCGFLKITSASAITALLSEGMGSFKCPQGQDTALILSLGLPDKTALGIISEIWRAHTEFPTSHTLQLNRQITQIASDFIKIGSTLDIEFTLRSGHWVRWFYLEVPLQYCTVYLKYYNIHLQYLNIYFSWLLLYFSGNNEAVSFFSE